MWTQGGGCIRYFPSRATLTPCTRTKSPFSPKVRWSENYAGFTIYNRGKSVRSTRRNGKVTRISANQWNLEIDHFWLVFNQKLYFFSIQWCTTPGTKETPPLTWHQLIGVKYSTVRGKRLGTVLYSTESGLWNSEMTYLVLLSTCCYRAALSPPNRCGPNSLPLTIYCLDMESILHFSEVWN